MEGFAEVADGRIWNRQTGAAKGRTLVVVHGGPEKAHAVTALARRSCLSLPPFVITAFAAAAVVAIGCATLQQQRPGRTFRDCDECPEMVVIPSGKFLMGDSIYGLPQHQVTIRSSFAIAKDMVTRNEYEAFVAESGYSAEKSLQTASSKETRNNPIVNVNWDDSQAYAKWLSTKAHHRYRLLSESEYEYAERAGTTTAYWWGDSTQTVCSYANFHDCNAGTTPVGSYLPNAFGLDDMAGNAFEWVEDCYHATYDGAPSDGTPWMSAGCSARVMRGTPWFMIDPTPLRSSYRAMSDSSSRSDVIGFRVARNL